MAVPWESRFPRKGALSLQAKCNTKLGVAMGGQYRRLSAEKRCAVAGLQAAGRSIRQIAADLDRSASTIARELKRQPLRQTITFDNGTEFAHHYELRIRNTR